MGIFYFMEVEIWKNIPDYEGLYQVSSYGRVKSLERIVFNKGIYPFVKKDKILRPIINKEGYFTLGLRKNSSDKRVFIHKLVAIAFLGHVPCGYKSVINHIDNNRLNNCVFNLEIVTQRENTNKKHIKSSSQYTGVSWDKPTIKWTSSIRINGKTKYLGRFINEIDAHLAYQKKLKEILNA